MPVQAVRFCRTCGIPWDPDWITCPKCAQQRPLVEKVAEARVALAADQRRIRSAMTLYFMLLGVSVVTIIVLLVSGQTEVGVPGELVEGIAMALITTGWCFGSFGDIAPLLRRLPRPWWLLPAGAGAAVVTFLIAGSAVALLQRLVHVQTIDYLKAYHTGGYGFGVAVLMICVQPAIFEELAFRGVILSALEPVIGNGEALLVSAMMFAILHLAIPSIPHLFIMGVALAWLKQRSGSLYPGMVLHFSHNFLVLLTEQHRSLSPW